MADTSAAHVSSLISDDLSDYGDFGEDVDDLDQLDTLLAQHTQNALSRVSEPADEPYQITDIEDYEPPRGLLVPKDLDFTRFPSLHPSQEAQVQVVRDQKTD
ncbi:hypothetical protein LTR66_017904, partial [Elasticomyces elasticus]